MPNKKGNILLPLIFAVALIAIVVAGYFFYQYQQKPETESYRPSPQTVTPTIEPSNITISAPISAGSTMTPVVAPGKYGFTKSVVLSGIGLKALFPQNVFVSLQEKDFYVVKAPSKAGSDDAVTFALKVYDGTGRRAWFQKTYPWAKNNTFEPFVGNDHRGYIAYATRPEDISAFFYFSVIGNKMLVISGNNVSSNNVNPELGNDSVFFTTDVEKFKSFLSTVQLTQKASMILEEFKASNLFRASDKSKIVWQDNSMGLRIITPEWTESRTTKEDRDPNGNFVYTPWYRSYPLAEVKDYPSFDGVVKYIEISGVYGNQYLSVLDSKYTPLSFSEVVTNKLLPSGFCGSEYKETKTSCASTDFCYTKDDVIQNLIPKKEIKIGTFPAQLRSMNENFSWKNDCRAEDVWLIKTKTDQYILTNVTPNEGAVRLEAI